MALCGSAKVSGLDLHASQHTLICCQVCYILIPSAAPEAPSNHMLVLWQLWDGHALGTATLGMSPFAFVDVLLEMCLTWFWL